MTKKKKDTSQDDKVRNLEEYQQTRPMQLDFFELLGIENKQYSRTIELYDFIPKYHWGKVERISGIFLKSLERDFECRGKHYTVTITPASVKNKNGQERYYYPSQREELIEDALRKLAVEGRSAFLDDQASVLFTLHQLQQELKQMGHSYSKVQIKQALYVCAKTNLEVKNEEGSTVLLSNIFETLGLRSFEDWKARGKDSKCFVRFNALVTASIKNMTFRRFNYEKAWSYKSVIARQLHKRLSHHYIQAGGNNNYTIKLTTLLRDFGLTRYNELTKNLRDVKSALEEMKTKGVLDKFQIESIVDSKRHNKLEDAKIILWTSYEFDVEAVETNRSRKNTQLPPSPSLLPK